MKKLLTTLSLALSIAAMAQVHISPVPQDIKWTDGSAPQNTKTIIGTRSDKAVKKFRARIPQRPEAYYLKVTPEEIVLAGNDDAGVFYAQQTLRQLTASDGSVACCEITDWPDIPERGVVEGFYGNPWSHEDRLRQFEFYGRNKMNVYIYGPKDDPYHRDRWRTPYPDDRAAKLKELNEAAAKNHVRFVWAIHPGCDIKWCKEDSINIINKLQTLYDLGIRHFAVFFDDIGGEGTRAEKQAGLLNYITKEFIQKKKDCSPLILCPTEYNKSWAGKTYLPTLGSQTNPEVRIMWTGARVVDMIEKDDTNWIISKMGRKPYIWLNWPVNDYCISHMLLGPTYGNGLDTKDDLTGFVSNPMEYAEASLISLYSIADYTWHQQTYQPLTSWQWAMKELMPQQADELQKFCEYNIDLGPNGHGLRRTEESARLKAMIEAGNTQGIKQELEQLCEACGKLLLGEHYGSFNINDGNLRNLMSLPPSPSPLIQELTPWLSMTMIEAARGICAINLRKAVADKNQDAAKQALMAIRLLEATAPEIRSRDYPGSIKNPVPDCGTLVLRPFTKKTMHEAEHYYRELWGNEDKLFTDPVLDDGQYYICYQGQRLTNIDANPNRTGDYPQFVAYNDTINPARQQWQVKMEVTTERYSIKNAQDSRYINDLGTFWQSYGNPFDTAWHTYILTKDSNTGLFSIQNAGSAGRKYWTIEDNRITLTDKPAAIFEIKPL